MVNQEMVPALNIRSLNQVLEYDRPAYWPIAYRKGYPLALGEFRHLVIHLISKIQSSPAKRWALCFNDSYYFLASLLAVWYCHRIAIIPGHLRQAQLIEQQNAFDALLTDLPLSLNCETLFLPLPQPHFSLTMDLPKWTGDGQLVLFTSGSTGKAKAIKKTALSLVLEIELIARQWREQLLDSVVVATVSHQHMYGLTFRIMLPLLLDLPFYTHLVSYHEQLISIGDALNAPLTLIASPAYLKRLDKKLTPIVCKKVFSAGGMLTFVEAQATEQLLGVLPQEIYGTTETGVIANRSQYKLKQPWQLFPSIEISVQPDETLSVISPLLFDPHGVKINDVIRLEDDGFHLIGRKDRIIKIEEKRVSLDEVEQRLLACPELAECAVITLQQDTRVILGAVLVLSALGQTKVEQQGKLQLTQRFRQELRNWLEPIAIPRRWRIVMSLPENSQGKRSQIQLQELFYEDA